MAYSVYLGGVLLPVTPDKIKVSINGQNKTVNLLDDSQVNILRTPGLTEAEFNMILPAMKYPWTNGQPQAISTYLGILESYAVSKQRFQFIVVRARPDGTPIYSTNLTMAIESYDIIDDHENGFDTEVDIKLKQSPYYGTKNVKLKKKKSKSKTTTQATVTASRDTSSAPQTSSYTVKKGDCLMAIAKKVYGDSSKWREIYSANKSTVGSNPNLIYPGQAFTIPASS